MVLLGIRACEQPERARVTSPDLGMGSAYRVLSHQMSMTKNAEKLFGVILDDFLPIFFMGNASLIFVFFQVALISKICFSPILCRAAEVLQSNTLSRRQSNTQVNKCTRYPDQHEVCKNAVHVNGVIQLKKVPTRTGPCCTPSTISCHSYGLASHQVLHDLALSCTISHKK